MYSSHMGPTAKEVSAAPDGYAKLGSVQVCVCAIVVSGCLPSVTSGAGTGGAEVRSAPGQADAPGTERQRSLDAQRLWQRRTDPDALSRAIATWQELRGDHPDAALLLRLSEAHHVYGQLGSGAMALQAFNRGAEAADAALAATTDPAERAGAAYWSLANRTALAARVGYLERIDQHQTFLRQAQQLASRASQVDAGGPLRILAALLASPPLTALRDLPRARRLYEAAIQAHPSDLANLVAFARHYAVAKQDLSTFQKTLRKVLAATAQDAAALLAKADAERLLARAPDLFE